jgi:hypothetical protein
MGAGERYEMIVGVIDGAYFILLFVRILNLLVGLVNSQMPEQAACSYSQMFGGICAPMVDVLVRTKLLQALGWIHIALSILFVGAFIYLAVAYWQ